MYYSIACEDCEDSLEKRKRARPEHLARLQLLLDEGRLLLAGPHPKIDSEDPVASSLPNSIPCMMPKNGPMTIPLCMPVSTKKSRSYPSRRQCRSELMNRVETIRQLLSDAFSPTHLDVIDESHFHKGHVGAAGGAGHFRVSIVSTQFSGQTSLTRHRTVYQALDKLMPGEIHALSIEAMTPEEMDEQNHSG